MTRLTWQNVEAPDLGRAADILNSAALQVGSGGASIGGALRNARSDQMDRRSAAVLPILAGIQGSGDVAGALSRIGGMIRPEDMNEETRAAYMGLMGQGLNFDAAQAGTAAVRGAEGRSATNHNRDIAREDQEAALAEDIMRRKEGGYRASLVGTESGGNFAARNGEIGSSGRAGHFGRVQFGQDRFDEAKNAGAIPADMSIEAFGSDTEAGRAAQKSAEDWHFGDLERQLAPYVGAVVNGQTLDMGALVAMGHLGGAGGAKQYVESGGQYNPADSNGVSLSDYAATHGGKGGGVADLIPEGNLLGMGFWDAQSDDYRAQEQEGYDRGRSRAADARTDTEAANLVRAQALLDKAIGGTTNQADVDVLIANSGESSAVQKAALGLIAADPAYVDSKFQVADDPNAPGLPGGMDAVTSLDETATMIRDKQNNDPTLRIQANAAEYSSDPASILANRMNDATDDGRAFATNAINEVVDGARERGINLSPAEAASLLKESAEYEGIFGAVDFDGKSWGNSYVSPAWAVNQAEMYMTGEQKRKGANLLSETQAAAAEVDTLRNRMAEEQRRELLATARGDEDAAAKHAENFSMARDKALTIEQGFTFFEKPQNGGKSSGDGAGGSFAAKPGDAEKQIQEAALLVTDEALKAATDGRVGLERLANAPIEQQVQLLKNLITQMTASGAPPQQIEALQALLQDRINADPSATIKP